jgi:hypothetical protein
MKKIFESKQMFWVSFIPVSVMITTAILGFYHSPLTGILMLMILPILLMTLFYDMVFLPTNFVNIIRLHRYLRKGKVKIIDMEPYPRTFGDIDIFFIEIGGEKFAFWLWNKSSISDPQEYTVSGFDPEEFKYKHNYIELFTATFILRGFRKNTMRLFEELRLKHAH